MIYKYKYTILSALLVTIFGLTSWTMYLLFHSQNKNIKHAIHAPDAFMEDVTAVIMNKQGKPKIKIVTPKMVHFSENDTTELESPQITLYRQSPIPWFITAKNANATQGIENVNLWDEVVIHHAADNKNPATLIKTPTLLVHPNQQTAQTNDLITMIQPSLVVNAVGMQADMNTGDIKLISHIRGEYVPNS